MNEVLADANILVRFLTNEPPDLADRAAVLLIRAGKERMDVVVPPIIMSFDQRMRRIPGVRLIQDPDQLTG